MAGSGAWGAELAGGGGTTIDPAGAAGESAVLQDIEVAVGLRFMEVGLDEVAGHAPPSIADLEEYRRRRRSWVATDGGDRPVAFLLTSVVDGNVHIDEVSVHPKRSHRGIGRALIEHVVEEAGRHGRPVVTLTSPRFRGTPRTTAGAASTRWTTPSSVRSWPASGGQRGGAGSTPNRGSP